MKSYKIYFSSESIEQIKSIENWYKGISKQLGKRFKLNLKIAIDNLKSNPFDASFRYDEVRYAVVKKFPYAAHCTVNKEQFSIIIHAVFAFKESPEKWVKE